MNVNVLCLKHGKKYSADYVNRLYNMVSRNLHLPFNFYCLTDDPSNIKSEIKILTLPSLPVNGWWYKPYIFSDKINITGTILYLDLDVVITSSIDKLFDYCPGKFCIIRDFLKVMVKGHLKYNSSVIRFEQGSLKHIYNHYEKNYEHIIGRYFGDQDYLYSLTRNQAALFPDHWIKSWKWEIRKNKYLDNRKPKGSRKFKIIEDVIPPTECCIAVFHGDPNPHLCDDPYIVKTWI